MLSRVRMIHLLREVHHHLHLDPGGDFPHFQVKLIPCAFSKLLEHLKHTINIVFSFLHYPYPGRSGPPPPGRGGPPLPGDGVVTLDSWKKSQVLLNVQHRSIDKPPAPNCMFFKHHLNGLNPPSSF